MTKRVLPLRAGALLVVLAVTLPALAAAQEGNRPRPEATEVWEPVPPIVRPTGAPSTRCSSPTPSSPT